MKKIIKKTTNQIEKIQDFIFHIQNCQKFTVIDGKKGKKSKFQFDH